VPAELELYNTPTSPINDVVYNSFWLNDTWKLTNRLTVNLGAALRGVPRRLAGAAVPTEWPPGSSIRLERFTLSVVRRAGDRRGPHGGGHQDGRAAHRLCLRLTGDNRTVLKVHYGQTRFNSADLLADQENPVGRARLRYRFTD
jgi:hypothetical protein